MNIQINTSIIPKHATILIGFSGGPDSIYLLLELKKLQRTYNLHLIALHLDHQWRTESGKDAQWCKEFCKKQDIQIISKKASDITIHKKYSGSKEDYARALRRAFVFAASATDFDAATLARTASAPATCL